MAKQKFSFSSSIDEIENIINQLENNEIDLDLLSEKVKRAAFLIKKCKNKLRETENHLEDIFEDDKD